MPTLAENPTLFLVEMRKKIKDLRKMGERPNTVSPAVLEEIAAHKKLVAMFEELDDWLEEGGDAPEQWVEKKSEF